ncbi:MAG: YbjQ family protein [Candidatus Marinimicrobia bacterium]|nr:YbjQ family protein [Candidatus Neomarinimicrobiota bacterium]
MIDKIQLLSTTSSIEGWSIEKYYGIVTYQLVIGANLFRDVFSSFRDIFGGSVKGYQKDLQNMENIAISNLKKNATKLGANLILGLRLDFDEVSGGNKSMFMLSVSGTAALGFPNTKQKVKTESEFISLDELDYEIEKDNLNKLIHTDNYLIESPEQIEELLKYKISAVEQVVEYIENYYPYFDDNKELIFDYFQNISIESINNYLISDSILTISKKTFYKLIDILEAINWFDYEVIFKLLKNDDVKAHIRALYLMDLEKEYYSQEDILKLEQLKNLVESVYSKYPQIQTSKKAFGKEKQEWTCLNCGTKNPVESTSCSKYECQANVYGIKNDQINPEMLKSIFSDRINKLKQLLNVT